uniref:Uncharacterized protein n=1 Tax=Romanomermis culicivorax TaxID=13658 RepID=A0A915I3D3_ROMCU
MANRCSSSPGRPIPMNTVTSTQSAPNVSKIRSTSVALSKNLLSKTFYQTKTVITSEPNNSIKIDPDKKLENRRQNQNVPSHRPTNSISQPSVFIPDRRPIVQISENKKSKKDNENSTNMDQNQNSNFHILTDTANNLGKTILLKQRLLRQAMIRQAYQLKKQQEKEWAAAPSSTSLRSTPFSPYGRFEPKILPPAGQHRPSTAVYPTRTTVENYFPFSFQNFAAQQNRVEWKLKKRADGSRYISRRVIRNKLLKTRAEQINSMRTGISSADDDAYSELKTGRYWTREERKRHFERSKERKRRQEELFRRKMLALAQSSEQTVLRLYQKNQHKRQGHELLDNFTTIQEYLSRDTRTVNDKISLGILTKVNLLYTDTRRANNLLPSNMMSTTFFRNASQKFEDASQKDQD